MLLIQCCCEIHNSASVGGMSCARWDAVPGAPSVKTSTLTLPLSIARTKTFNMESLPPCMSVGIFLEITLEITDS